MNAGEVKKHFPNEDLRWWEQKTDDLTYWSAFKQLNLKGVLFWVWCAILVVGIGSASFLNSFDFAIFGLFIPLGLFHFHSKAQKAVAEANVVYGITSKHIFKLLSAPNEKLTKYPLTELVEIKTEAETINFLFEADNKDFSKNDLKGVVSFNDVSIPNEVMRWLDKKISVQ